MSDAVRNPESTPESASASADDAPRGDVAALEKERDEHRKASNDAEEMHHRLTVAATLLHMAIAIATIAIIARKKWPWLASIVLGVAGTAIAAWAYL